MKKNILFFALFLLLSTCCMAQDDKEMVKQTFNNYKSAILNNKGQEALSYVDSRTLKYYAELIEVVKHGDSSKINSLSIMDKVIILSVRHEATMEEIRSMNDTGLFLYSIKKGMVGKGSVKNNTIGDVLIDGGFAKGQLVIDQQRTEVYLYFYKEQKKWQLDFTSLFTYMNIVLKEMIEAVGLSENEYILMLLESITGKKPRENIWQPLL